MIKQIMLFILLTLPGLAVSADESVLHLKNGDFVPGKLLGSDQPTVFRWKSSSFEQSLDFSQEHIDAIHYSVPADLPKPQGEYCVELRGGDVLFGDLLGLTESSIEIDAKRFGRVHIKRDQLCRLYRWDQGTELIHLGPNGLVGWTESPSKEPQWRSAGGLPMTDKPGTHIRGDFRLPPQAAIEFELSWTKLPNFVFGLGVDDSDADTVFNRAFRFEVWDTDLVVG